MKYRIRLNLVLSAIIFQVTLAYSQSTVCLNEIMQSNIDCLYANHDYPDSWVELYNPTGSTIDLYQYAICANNDLEKKYVIPSHTTIKSKGYVVIYCDKENTGLHTNFRLESTEAGSLSLFNSEGAKVDNLDYPVMIAPNVAYGRKSDGKWEWEVQSTPGSKNSGKFTDILLPEPLFNKSGGMLSNPIALSITMPTNSLPSDAKIYYTTDGSEPTTASKNGSSVSLNIDKSTVVRAKIISSEAIIRPSTTHSYLFHPRATQLPIISFVTNHDYLYDAKEGIFSSEKTNGQYNYDYNWRRPVNAEMFNTSDNNQVFNQLGEVAVGGNFSREFVQKSIKLYAHKRFGTKRLYGNFWAEKPEVTASKSITFRNGGNALRNLRITDAYLQRIWGTHIQNIDYQAYSPSIVYINGEFYGFAGLRERSNEDWVEANYGLENIEYASHLSYRAAESEHKTTSFQQVYQLYSSNSCTYEQLAEKIDVDNFMKSMIAEMNAVNHDWPHNNVAMWRPNEEGAKWRWILKDLDFYALSSYDNPLEFNMFNYLLGTVNADEIEYRYFSKKSLKESAKLYKKMISFPQFKEDFINAYMVYLGDFLRPAVTNRILDEMTSEILEEINATYNLYEFKPIYFTRAIDRAKNHNTNRPRIVYNQMATFFSLGSVIPMTIQVNGSEVSVNDIQLTEGDFDGAWFSSRPIELESKSANKGWKMERWKKSNGTVAKMDEQRFPQTILSIEPNQFSTADSLAFSVYTFEDSEFDQKLRELAIVPAQQHDWSEASTISLTMPNYAYANISDLSGIPTSKDDIRKAHIDFYDNNGNRFSKKILISAQGNSKPKANLSISFCDDEWEEEDTPDITFGEWVPQDEFHLKAFYEDGIRGTAEIAYKLYGQITQRSNCRPDAFPMSLYINGDFYGIMAWQLKKHRDNMGLSKKEPTNVWLDGTLNDKQVFGGSINWTKFEVRNPKDLKTMDGSDYDGDAPQELIDETSSAYDASKAKMVRTALAKSYIIDLSETNSELTEIEKSGATIEEMRRIIRDRFDVPELVNYMVFSLVTNNYDGFSKNWQWFTYDGSKWTVAPYDCHLTFGYNEAGTDIWPASQGSKKYDYRLENVECNGPMRWIRKYFWEEVRQRYSSLRESGIVSTGNITTLFDNWTKRIGSTNYSEEWERWKDSPIRLGSEESHNRFESWNEQRIALDDIYLGYRTETSTYQLTVSSAGWATICVPFAFDVPKGMIVYSVIGIDNSKLILQPTSQTLANRPYIVSAPAGKYSLSGTHVVGSSSEDSYLTNGLLVGTLNDIFVPADSYVLQSIDGVVGFYHVSFENTIQINANRAYLALTNESIPNMLLLPEAIENLQQIYAPGRDTYYNIWGQRIPASQSGVFITIDSKGNVKKSLEIDDAAH